MYLKHGQYSEMSRHSGLRSFRGTSLNGPHTQSTHQKHPSIYICSKFDGGNHASHEPNKNTQIRLFDQEPSPLSLPLDKHKLTISSCAENRTGWSVLPTKFEIRGKKISKNSKFKIRNSVRGPRFGPTDPPHGSRRGPLVRVRVHPCPPEWQWDAGINEGSTQKKTGATDLKSKDPKTNWERQGGK